MANTLLVPHYNVSLLALSIYTYVPRRHYEDQAQLSNTHYSVARQARYEASTKNAEAEEIIWPG